MDEIADMLGQKEIEHGDFTINSMCALDLGMALQEAKEASGARLGARQAMALLAICTKLARIVSSPLGASNDDNWKDIEGYCRLARADGAEPGRMPATSVEKQEEEE